MKKKNFKRVIKTLYEQMDRRIISLFARSGLLASFYYLLFSRKFDREHKSVLQGRLAYWRSTRTPQASSPLLRRNTHRLEKGLIMQPRKPVFAEDYIYETVQAYEAAVNRTESDELRWAYDVLSEYFSVVEFTPVIRQAHDKFKQITDTPENVNGQADSAEARSVPRSVPGAHRLLPEATVSTEALHQLFKRRRATRWFVQKQVPAELLQQAATMASLAPSACNRQPYRFHVIDNQQQAAKVAGLAMGTTGFADNIPALIVVVGQLDAYPAERDRHCIYIDASLASMQFMLAAETMGLATCPINWPDIEKRERMLARELKLSDYERAVMLMAVGYPDPEGGVPFSQKKPHSVLMRQD